MPRNAALAVITALGAGQASADDGKIRGVNLGGWLVLEPWITPNLFEVMFEKRASLPPPHPAPLQPPRSTSLHPRHSTFMV